MNGLVQCIFCNTAVLYVYLVVSSSTRRQTTRGRGRSGQRVSIGAISTHREGMHCSELLGRSVAPLVGCFLGPLTLTKRQPRTIITTTRTKVLIDLFGDYSC